MSNAIDGSRYFDAYAKATLATPDLFTWSAKAPAQTDSERAVQALVVTAERRTDNIRDVTIATAMLSWGLIEEVDFSDAKAQKDNALPAGARSRTNPGCQEYSIRGIRSHTTDEMAAGSTVGFYIHDIE